MVIGIYDLKYLALINQLHDCAEHNVVHLLNLSRVFDSVGVAEEHKRFPEQGSQYQLLGQPSYSWFVTILPD